MFKEFKEFVTRGNMVDLAIAVILGAAFGMIITSLVNDVILPPIGLLLGKIDFTNLFITLGGPHFNTLAEAKAGGAVTLNYGLFIGHIVNFTIIAFCIFIMVKQINRFKKQPVPAAPTEKECPYCKMNIPIAALRCPHCTSEIKT